MTDTQVMAALEPCPNPFCEWRERDGDFTPALRLHHHGNYRVVCTSCILEGPTRRTKDEAIAAWNHRLASSPAAEPVAWMYERTWEDYTPSREVRVQQWSTTEGRYFGWIETPLYATPSPPPAVDAEVRKALEASRDLIACIKQRSSDNLWWVDATDPETAVCDAHTAVEKALSRDEEDPPCPICGNEVRGQGGYLQCECPATPSVPAQQGEEERREDTHELANAIVIAWEKSPHDFPLTYPNQLQMALIAARFLVDLATPPSQDQTKEAE